MSRVATRPRALMDGAEDPSRIVEHGSDAARYFDGSKVPQKIGSLTFHLTHLTDPDSPRLGAVRNNVVGNHVVCTVQGEYSGVTYGFGLAGDDKNEFIEVSAIEGDNTKVLGYLDRGHEGGELVFREPETLAVIDPASAQAQELTQMFAIAVDAAEWAMD
jgi:hypothetical protein